MVHTYLDLELQRLSNGIYGIYNSGALKKNTLILNREQHILYDALTIIDIGKDF